MVEGTMEGSDKIVLPPALVANTALASLNVHSGILLLEEGIMAKSTDYSASFAAAITGAGGVATAGERRRRGGGRAVVAVGGSTAQGEGGHQAYVEGQQDMWLHLSKLYAALGERDALVGVAARSSRLEETRCVCACFGVVGRQFSFTVVFGGVCGDFVDHGWILVCCRQQRV